MAQALNVSTDALFGFNAESFDMKLAEEVKTRADELRDSGEQSQGALSAVEYLDKQCDSNMFNYGIYTRYVQAVAHMSRFVNPKNSYYVGLLENDSRQWKQIIRQAENRAMQVIRYAGNKKLTDECHYALAWLCWHTQEWEKGRQHIEALPSISNNMLQETLLPYYINRDTEDGKKDWQAQIRDNYQNYIRAINKQIVYTAEAMMWVSSLDETETHCRWGIAIMDEFVKNDKMIAYCQGFYRETYKFLIVAYLRNNEPKKAAKEWKILIAKIDEYVDFCNKLSEMDYDEMVCSYGIKAANNMKSYTKEYIDSKLDFMLGQLESLSSNEVYEEFKKLI